jgi:hypothetical protein
VSSPCHGRQSAREEEELEAELGPFGHRSPTPSFAAEAPGGLPDWYAAMLTTEAAQMREAAAARRAAAAVAAAAARQDEISEVEQALEMRRLELHFLSDQINQIAARQQMQQAAEPIAEEEDDDDDAYVPFGAMSES